VITAYVRCSDGPEGDWVFTETPRLGERVTLSDPRGFYKVVKVEHYPSPAGRAAAGTEPTVALRLLLIDGLTDPAWGDGL